MEYQNICLKNNASGFHKLGTLLVPGETTFLLIKEFWFQIENSYLNITVAVCLNPGEKGRKM